MINIALCDDDARYISRNRASIETILAEAGVQAAVSTFSQGGDLLRRYAEAASPFDLLILDIEMPGMNGLELAADIRKTDAGVLIIFLTSHEKYVYSSFEHSPFRYIPKLHFDSYMPKALRDACNALEAQRMKAGFYVAETAQAKTVLPYHTIRCIEKQGRLCVFYLTSGETLSIKKNIKELWAELGGSLFAMVHSGSIVNMKYIRQIQKDVCILDNGDALVVSRANRQILREAVHRFWGEAQ